MAKKTTKGSKQSKPVTTKSHSKKGHGKARKDTAPKQFGMGMLIASAITAAIGGGLVVAYGPKLVEKIHGSGSGNAASACSAPGYEAC